jgi:hypothetical protein
MWLGIPSFASITRGRLDQQRREQDARNSCRHRARSCFHASHPPSASRALAATSPGQRAVRAHERADGAVRLQDDGHGGAGSLLDRLHALKVVERRRGKARADGVHLDAFRAAARVLSSAPGAGPGVAAGFRGGRRCRPFRRNDLLRAVGNLCLSGSDAGACHSERMVDLLIDALRYGARSPAADSPPAMSSSGTG